MTPPIIRDAARKAAEWLLENRDKHIGGNLAMDASYTRVSPTDPSAVCFCAIGRLAKELDVGGKPLAVEATLVSRGLPQAQLDEIMRRNDRDTAGFRDQAGRDGARALQELADATD